MTKSTGSYLASWNGYGDGNNIVIIDNDGDNNRFDGVNVNNCLAGGATNNSPVVDGNDINNNLEPYHGKGDC